MKCNVASAFALEIYFSSSVTLESFINGISENVTKFTCQVAKKV
jgi:hypothetical protein